MTIYVQGLDDTAVEGSTYDTITHTVLSGDGAGYTTGLVIAPVSVLVDDNDTPAVRVIETDGGTHVVEAGDTDSYQVVLDLQPVRGCDGPVHGHRARHGEADRHPQRARTRSKRRPGRAEHRRRQRPGTPAST